MPDLKVTQQHLERDAFLYIRQSTPRQVLENTESTQRQYALRDRAVALGWPLERIHVLDCDLGKSGSQSAGRHGFQKQIGIRRAHNASMPCAIAPWRWAGRSNVSTYSTAISASRAHSRPAGTGFRNWSVRSRCRDRKSTRLNSSHLGISY